MKPLLWDSINPFTGTPFTFDDPNLFWGDPAYYLEPGDSGFVPYPGQIITPPTPKPKAKTHTMPKQDFMPGDDTGKAELFVQFRDNVGDHLATLGILPTDPDIVQQAKDATYFRATVDLQQTMQAAGQSWTSWKNYVRDGGATTVPTPALPALPGTFPPVVPPGIVNRFRTLRKRFVAIPACSPAIRQALGLDGPEMTPPDLTTIAPVITATLQGNQVLLGWDWGGNSQFLDMCELQKDSGSGFQLLAMDTTPGYTDTTPLPATPTKWRYRAIYRVGDAQVGVWSSVVEITVGG